MQEKHLGQLFSESEVLPSVSLTAFVVGLECDYKTVMQHLGRGAAWTGEQITCHLIKKNPSYIDLTLDAHS